ncbi:MAG: hypothetical protein O7A04_09130 [Acidobacteria bacterium]|nr:hypothetical protein [Acidobacteriota bacterium]
MTHEATVELLSRLLDGDVSAVERERIEERIETDAETREIYEGLRRVRSSLGQLADAAPPAYLGALVHRRVALEAEKVGLRSRLERRLHWLLPPMLLPAFAVVLALAAMFYLLANGLARYERAHEPLILSAPPGSARGPEVVEIDSRVFVREGSRWLESDLTPAAVATARQRRVRPDEIAEWARSRPRLAALAELGVVVVELDGEIVELVFETGSD